MIEVKNGVVIYTNDSGQWHREDGPALESVGNEEWYFNGLRHRDNNQPALISKVGGRIIHVSYWRHGKLHREDGPAIVWFDNVNKAEYWINGIKLDKLYQHDLLAVL